MSKWNRDEGLKQDLEVKFAKLERDADAERFVGHQLAADIKASLKPTEPTDAKILEKLGPHSEQADQVRSAIIAELKVEDYVVASLYKNVLEALKAMEGLPVDLKDLATDAGRSHNAGEEVIKTVLEVKVPGKGMFSKVSMAESLKEALTDFKAIGVTKDEMELCDVVRARSQLGSSFSHVVASFGLNPVLASLSGGPEAPQLEERMISAPTKKALPAFGHSSLVTLLGQLDLNVGQVYVFPSWNDGELNFSTLIAPTDADLKVKVYDVMAERAKLGEDVTFKFGELPSSGFFAGLSGSSAK
jgi:hypothetical protein